MFTIKYTLIVLACLAATTYAGIVTDYLDEVESNFEDDAKDFVEKLNGYGKNPNKVDLKCVLSKCGGKILPAMVSPKFLHEAACENTCNPFYYNDTTPEKVHYQNCTTKCALTYESKAGDDFMACAMTYNCMTFAPIDVTCPHERLATFIEPDASLANLTGEWWQHYGYNALWDCYPCQHIHSHFLVDDADWCGQNIGPDGPVQAPCWNYTYSYDLFTMTGTKYFGQSWQLPMNEPGKPIDIYYEYQGSTHNETWYILSATENYVVLVDCSYMSGWTNVGSIVWVRPDHVLDDNEMVLINNIYDLALGW